MTNKEATAKATTAILRCAQDDTLRWGQGRRGGLDLLDALDVADALDPTEFVDEAVQVADVDGLDDEVDYGAAVG